MSGTQAEVLVLDLDGTLRDLVRTDGRIPQATLEAICQAHHARPQLHVVVNTGQTLEHVMGLVQQVFGRRVVYSGRFAIVYEHGAGVYLPGPLGVRKIPLYALLDRRLLRVFDRVREGIFHACRTALGWGCREFHLQGNEFNVALKPNAPEGSREADRVCRAAAALLLRVLAECAAAEDGQDAPALEAALVAEARREAKLAFLPAPGQAALSVPDWLAVQFFYYPADLVGLSARQLTKVTGLEAVLHAWGLDQPRAVVLGDGEDDLEVMRAVAGWPGSLVACPEGAREAVRAYVNATQGVVYPPGRAELALQAAGVTNGA